ncbi:unnamed protein product (macronuclear) [Paramecium tetraurelia]|uniref:Uncharacterized protein n=1 Tax=Paramecium tetraurelia TaxID=5888 RepID=A0CUL0_PARTE|nr:uncharacterized protein GSPATT00010677001 [Paramecium tetraurelia]CAK74477.1 unnamed protein product [Paramecium tetraurelia]|eukprot:XP_001441874.1 hypothetical protein (macronuclear) [Paramecium tetraurelia strain d4-2]
MREHIEDEVVASFEQKRGINYQHEYMRLYIANVVLTQQLKELLQEKGDLISKINRLEETEVCKPNSRKQDYEDSKKIEQPSKKQIGISIIIIISAEGSTKYNDENVVHNHQYQTRKLIKKN